MKPITNKVLAERTGIPHSKIRRWAKEFLPPDPQATLRSGYTKEYSLNDAFTVCLAGCLVSKLNFEVYEARKIIEDLMPWLSANGQLPVVEEFSPKTEHGIVKRYEIVIARNERTYLYRIVGDTNVFMAKIESYYRLERRETLEYEFPIPEDATERARTLLLMGSLVSQQNHKILKVSILLDWLMRVILETEADYEAWKKARWDRGIPTIDAA